MICTEATLDHNTGIDTATTEAAQDDLTIPSEDTPTDLTITHQTGHTVDHPHITALQGMDPKIIVGHTHDHPTELQGMNYTDQIHTLAGQEEGHIPRRT